MYITLAFWLMYEVLGWPISWGWSYSSLFNWWSCKWNVTSSPLESLKQLDLAEDLYGREANDRRYQLSWRAGRETWSWDKSWTGWSTGTWWRICPSTCPTWHQTCYFVPTILLRVHPQHQADLKLKSINLVLTKLGQYYAIATLKITSW